ncbi:MAG: DUF4864 domain-containing protein [Halomonas sp.]|nr:DUF4864 domain-containing protein [Halomonas sp.]TVM07861.1 MAG: DUF4864 domain-containing protein [Halomonas sp.]
MLTFAQARLAFTQSSTIKDVIFRTLPGWRRSHGASIIAALGLLISLMVAPSLAAQSMVEPKPSFSPEDVVRIQLDALAANDEPTRNAGIEQVWAFAHPNNRAVTGPLERFTRMIRGAGYDTLIDHRSYTLEAAGETDQVAGFEVRVVARDGNLYAFSWRLGIADIDGQEVWMTTRVTPARSTGEQMTSR